MSRSNFLGWLNSRLFTSASNTIRRGWKKKKARRETLKSLSELAAPERLEGRALLATLDFVGPDLTYNAVAGVANNLTVSTPDGIDYVFNDTAEQITAVNNLPFGCSGGALPANLVTINCTAAIDINSLTINLGDLGDIINIKSTRHSTSVNAGSGDDAVAIGDSSLVDGIRSVVSVAGGGQSGDTITFDDSLNNVGKTLGISATQLGTGGGFFGAGGTVSYNGISELTVSLGGGNDRVAVSSTSAKTNLSGNAGTDTFQFGVGATLSGGTIDGGADDDTIDYSSYSTAVAVNLGTNAASFVAKLQGLEETPANFSTASGTATLIYDSVARTFSLSGTVSGLFGTITGFHLHQAAFGVAGPVIVGFAVSDLVPSGTPGEFTFSRTGVALPATSEAALLGGITYLNIHTSAFPGGEIRGQVFANAVFGPAPGTATGTTGITSVENALGGTRADSLVGNDGSNILKGNSGEDILVGGRGSDVLEGGNNNDIIAWSNGDGSDTMDGNTGVDLVQVNGSVAAGDDFSIAPAAGGRVAFKRNNLVPFNLDIGGADTLSVIGIGGDDVIGVSSLVGVTGLSQLNLAGLDGNDTFNVAPAATGINIAANGFAPRFPANPGDVLNIDLTGVTAPILFPNGNDLPLAGDFLSTNRGTVSFAGVDDLSANLPYGVGVNAGSDPAPGNQMNDGNADVFRAVRNGDNLEIYVNSSLVFNDLFDSVVSLGFAGSNDDDRVIIDHAGGFINRSIIYNGGQQKSLFGDSLSIVGTPAGGLGADARETYLVGTTEDAGRWIIDPNGNKGAGAALGSDGDEMIVNFTGLEPADSDVAVTNFDLILNASNDQVAIRNGILGAPFTTPNMRIVDLGGTFETTSFANKTNVRVMGASGNDTLTLDYTIPAAGLASLELFGHVAAGVGGQPADDDGDDTLAFDNTPASIPHGLFGNGGNDLFTPTADNLDGVEGNIDIQGGGGTDVLNLNDALSGTSNSITVNSSTVTGAAPAVFTYDVDIVGITTSENTADTVDVISTQAGTDYYIQGSVGAQDEITIGNTTADFQSATFDGTLDQIAGHVIVLPGSAVDVLNVDDSGTVSLNGVASISDIDGQNIQIGPVGAAGLTVNLVGRATRLSNFAGANIDYFHDLGAARLEQLNVRASMGADVINVNDTTATVASTVDAREGDDVLTIRGDFLGAENTILGHDGNDDFTMTIVLNVGQAAFAPITSLSISGNSNPVADSNNRDRLTINDLNAGFARNLNYDYLDSQGDLNLLAGNAGSGLFGANGGGVLSLSVLTMETMIFESNDANDTVMVTGTSSDDLLTVALTADSSSGFVFLDGNPYLDVPPESLSGFLPGLAGGGAGVDLLIHGINPNAGIVLDGSGVSSIGNRAVVQASSEDDLVIPGGTNDVFNLGAGVLVPGAGPGNAYDLIAVNGAITRDSGVVLASAANQVVTQNLALGNLLTVTVNPDSFVNGDLATSRPGLTVNAGDELDSRANGVADHIAAQPHSKFNLAINGNLPTLDFGSNGLPIGDQLDLQSPSSFSIWSDKSTPPTVSIIAGNDQFCVLNSSIERTFLVPGNGVINLVGDNNTVGHDQDDNFVVVGRDVDGDALDAGYQEATLVINGSAPIKLDGVQFLNAYGFDLVGVNRTNPGINGKSDPEDGGIDTLDVRPYADNTPRGWGIHVNFNEGAPAGVDGDQADLLIYRTSLFGGPVSEAIVVQPSAPDAGQLFSNNSSTNTPIVVVDYLANTDIQVLDDDGFASDTDSLALRGTNPDAANPLVSGNDTVVANFTAVGNAADPMVVVTDSNTGTILYRVQTIANLNMVNIELLKGTDRASVIGRLDGSLTINVDGGTDSQADRIELPGNNNGSDQFEFVPGSSTSDATVRSHLAGALLPTTVNLHNVDSIFVNGGAGTGTDRLRVSGTTGVDQTTVRPTTALAGTVTIGSYPTINYSGLGSTGSTLELLSDTTLTGPDDSLKVVGTNGADVYGWTPTSVADASLTLTDSSAAQVAFQLQGFSAVSLDAGNPGPTIAPADRLNVMAANATIVSGGSNGSGTVNARDAANQPLLGLSYIRVENPVLVGGTVIISGTENSDVITVGFEDLAGDGTADQEVVRVNGNPFDITAANAVVIHALAGDDAITISPESGLNLLTIPGGLTVIGGEASGDTLTVSTLTAVGTAVNLASGGSILGVITSGALTLGGVETVSIVGANAVANPFTISNYGVAGDIRTLNVNGGDTDNNDGDTVSVSMTSGPDLATYTSLSPTSAMLTRGTAGPTINITRFNSADDNLQVDGLGNIDAFEFVGSASNDRITVTQSTIVGLTRATLEANLAFKWVPVSFGSFNSLYVTGSAGNDQTVVDNSNGLVSLSSGITYDGQDGNDLLRLQGTTAVNTVTYNVGPGVNEGSVIHETQVATQRVFFRNLEPVIDVVAGALVVNATNSANQINYSAVGGNGLIAVDGFETLEFAGKSNVTINGRSGDDSFSVVNSTAGFNGSLTINGGDPSSQDTLIINASGGTVAINTVASTITGAGPATINYSGISSISAVIDPNAPAATLALSGASRYVYSPAVAANAGSIQAGDLPVTFTGLGADDTLQLTGTGGTDSLVTHGTTGDDVVNVVSGSSIGIAGRVTISTQSIENLNALSGDGNDIINVASAANPYEVVEISAGTGSDLVQATGDGSAVIVQSAVNGSAVQGGGLSTTLLSMTSSESVNLINGLGDITFNGTGANEHYVLTPLSANAARVAIDGAEAVFRTENQGLLTIDDGVAGDSDTLSVHLSAAAETIEVSSTSVAVTAGATLKTVHFNSNGLESLRVHGHEGADTFVVSPINGLSMFIDGGEPNSAANPLTGGDRLSISADLAIAIHELGVEPDEGTVSTDIGDIGFDHIESMTITDLIGNDIAYTAVATNADDDITLHGLGPNTYSVSINGGPAVVVVGSSSAQLRGLNGDDDFDVDVNVANLGVAITVDGGLPSVSSDILTLTGTSNGEAIGFAPVSADSGTVSIGVVVNYTMTEHVIINGGGGGDQLSIITTAGADALTYIPGANSDAGSVNGSSAGGALTPMSFLNLGLQGSVQFQSGQIGEDALDVHGTTLDDVFTLSSAGVVQITDAIGLSRTLPISTSGVAFLQLHGLAGRDTYNVAGTNLFGTLSIHGGGLGDGDRLNLTSPLSAVTMDVGAAKISGYGVADFGYSGLSDIHADAGRTQLNVIGTTQDDTIAVLVGGANSGTVRVNAQLPVIHYSNTAGNALNVDPIAGQDRVNVTGNALSQTFVVDIPGQSLRVDDLNNLSNDGVVTWSQGTEAIGVYGLEGDDTFNITAGAIPLFFDGGDPIGQTPGDRFIINANGAGVTFEAGPENDEGGILVGNNARLSFDHIEAGTVAGAGCVIISGTNGDDDITIIARTELTNPLRFATADGNKDFTSSINGGIEVLWINNDPAVTTADLFVDARSGDDDVVFQVPALNPNTDAPIAWNVNARVVGGSPSAVTGDQGDAFELATPGQNRMEYRPTGSDTGVIRLDSANVGAAFDTTISLVQSFTVSCNGNGVVDYASSTGGFELLTYDGETADDGISILDTTGNDRIVHSPNAGRDEGSIRVNETLALIYQNLGLNGSVRVNAANGGGDSLVVNGTGTSDQIIVDRVAADTGRVRLNSQLALLSNGVELYVVNALEGDDRIVVQLPLASGVTGVTVNGGGPGASDSLTFVGESGVANAFIITPAPVPHDGGVAITGSSPTATSYTGIEHLLVQGNAGDADNLTINDDRRDNLWTVAAGTAGDRVQLEGRESIDLSGFQNVVLSNLGGTDHFRVYPTNLTGYTGSLTVNGFANTPVSDVLEIVGTAGTDVISSTASTITTNDVNVTAGANLIEIQVSGLGGDDSIVLALGLVGTRKVISGGDGNDTINASAMQDATIFGGTGDDNITGSPVADLIYGGSGNDIILGLAGADTIYGDEGNDTITGGTGNDQIFGGAGSDRNIWNNGDNTDVFEGDDGVDVQIVNGATAAGDVFVLRTKTGDASRAFFERTNLIAFSIDMGKVEQVDINGGGGSESITVRDLATTDIRQVNVDVGAAAETDAVNVHGRTVSDQVTISAQGTVVNIAGLSYDVNVASLASVADGDTLTFNANAGNDVVTATDNLQAIFGTARSDVNHLMINGGDGDDYLSGFGQLNGEAGNDTLVGNETPADGILVSQTLNGDDGDDTLLGGDGDDELNGGAGEDLFVGGSGADTIDGGDDWDTILIRATSGPDVIDVNQIAADKLNFTVNGSLQVDTLVVNAGSRTVEEVRIDAGSGADTIRVQNLDALSDANFNSLQMTVHGGTHTGAGDRLIIVDNGVDDLTVYRKGATDSEGTVTVGPGNAEPLEVVFDGVERVQFVDEAGVAPNASAGAGSQLAVFPFDAYEYNDDRFVATHIGANETVNLSATIDPGVDPNFGAPGDRDFYRVVADVNGTLDFQVYFRQIGPLASGRPGLPNAGNLDINVRDAAGNIIAGFGVNDATDNERVRIPAVAGQTYYLEVFGNGTAINNYNATVISQLPPVPYDLELQDTPVGDPPPANSDTGRSQFDNTTRDNTPTLFLRLDDAIFRFDVQGNDNNAGGFPNNPPDEVIPIPFQTSLIPGYRIAIFDEGPTPGQPATNPQIPLGFATAVAGSPGLYSYTTPILSDGSHFLSARVQMVDPSTPTQSGYGERSVSLEIVVDIAAPPSFFGFISAADTTAGLDSASDSGVNGYSATNVDRVTNDTTPTFFGRAEADAIVRVYVDTNGVAGLQSSGANADRFIGLTVALPYDGSNQFPNGQWQLTSTLNLNDIGLGSDGLRRVFVTAEDLAGNVTPDANADLLNIFLDTRGPQITKVDINNLGNSYNIFDHKGTPDGLNDGYLLPTPLVNSLVISVRDLPARSNADPNFLYAALFAAVAVTPGHYSLVGDARGVIPIKSVTFVGNPTADGAIATGTITLTFFEPLPDDRFTFRISDDLVDPVGNHLDGESHAVEPHDIPSFPSGDGVPGGSFKARFTVDSRPELGGWDSGSVWVDTNGNNRFDPDNFDFVNRDIVYSVRHATSDDKFFTSDDVIAGNFSPLRTSTADGFAKLAAYGKDASGNYRWLIDTNNDGVADLKVIDPAAVNGIPFAGDFDGNAANGDEVGVYDGTTWFLDTNHDYKVEVVGSFTNGLRGWPIAGDFDGDGKDDLGSWSDDSFMFDLANNGFGQFDASIAFGFIGVRERPVAADMDRDGIDDIGLWVPDRAGQNPEESAEWYFLVSNDPTGTLRNLAAAVTPQDRINRLDHAFKPEPFGKDLYALFGDEYAMPLVGNFDPPVSFGAGESDPTRNPLDVNADGKVNNVDAILLINDLNHNGPRRLSATPTTAPYVDVNGDLNVNATDAVLVINHLNSTASESGAAEGGEGEVRPTAAAFGPAESSRRAATAFGSTVTQSPVAGAAVQGSREIARQTMANPLVESFEDLLDRLAADVRGASQEDSVDELFKRL